MAESRVGDPASAFRFQVTAQPGSGNISAGFTRAAGLRDESEVIEYREGTDPIVKRKIPGLRTFPVVTLARGLTAQGLGLKLWRDAAIDCAGDFRAETRLTVRNCDGVPARQVVWERAWPVALEIGDLDAGASEVAVENLELQHEGRRASVSIFEVAGSGSDAGPAVSTGGQ